MTGLGDALGVRADSEYGTAPPSRWSQPWSSWSVRVLTVLGAFVVGFVLVAALVAGRDAAVHADARKSQLVALVSARQERAGKLARQLEQLRARATRVETSAVPAGAPLLRAELDRLEAATGLTALRGPGLQVTFSDGRGVCPTGRDEDCRIQDADLQLAVNSLFGLGAEGVAVNGERMIATTAIRSAGSSILVNYRVLTSPYVVEAVGDPQQLEDGFSASQLAEDFSFWQESYNLGFSIAQVEALMLPAYSGALRVNTSGASADASLGAGGG